jgi:hypothetical protein
MGAVYVHRSKTDSFLCEDNRKIENLNQLTDQEKRELFLIVDVAAELHMTHNYSLWEAIDIVKNQRDMIVDTYTRDPNIPHSLVITSLIRELGHKCVPACSSPKIVE